MTTTMLDLVHGAALLGITVHLAHLTRCEPRLRAHYDDFAREILVDVDLTLAEKKEALAHEIGHALERDTVTDDVTERRAFRHAARLLVSVEEYRAAELLNSDPCAIAEELGVTPRIVYVFQQEWLPSLVQRRYAS